MTGKSKEAAVDMPNGSNMDEMNDVYSLLQSLVEKEGCASVDSKVQRLKGLLKSLIELDDFKVGDIVVWRSGLKNRSFPEYGTPAIVVEVLSPPLMDESADSGSTYFREPLNLRLGIIDEKGDFLTFVYDGRRFEHYRDAGDRLRQLLDSSGALSEGGNTARGR